MRDKKLSPVSPDVYEIALSLVEYWMITNCQLYTVRAHGILNLSSRRARERARDRRAVALKIDNSAGTPRALR